MMSSDTFEMRRHVSQIPTAATSVHFDTQGIESFHNVNGKDSQLQPRGGVNGFEIGKNGNNKNSLATETYTPDTFQPPKYTPNSRTKLVCNSAECKNQKFGRLSDYKKHIDRHDRPYKCNNRECTSAFAAKGDLKRHQRTKHGISTSQSKPLLYCTERGCPRATTKPFSRKDNRDDHLRRVHGKRDMTRLDPGASCILGDDDDGTIDSGYGRVVDNDSPKELSDASSERERREVSARQNASLGSINAKLESIDMRQIVVELLGEVKELKQQMRESKKREEVLKRKWLTFFGDLMER